MQIGVGLLVNDLEGIAHSYETAKYALQYGHSKLRINFYDDVELIALLKSGASPLNERFSTRILAGVRRAAH